VRVREAKDFLVEQTAEQARLEGVPLSEIEKRMMYFTEGPGALEDPAKLNEEFEAEYDNDEYEKKISKLMSHARAKLKKQDLVRAIHWDNAIKCLQKGDHYILVLAGNTSLGQIRNWRITLAAITPVIAIFVLFLLVPRFLPAPRPYAIRILQVLFLALLVIAIFFPRAFLPAGRVFGRCLDWIDGTDKEKEKIE
jgi:Na+-transporting NADH:ubiquinone oxidoreductase subunit NqrB